MGRAPPAHGPTPTATPPGPERDTPAVVTSKSPRILAAAMRPREWDDYEEAVMAGRADEAVAPGDGYEMSEAFKQWIVDRMRDEVMGQVSGAGLDRMAILKDAGEAAQDEAEGTPAGGPDAAEDGAATGTDGAEPAGADGPNPPGGHEADRGDKTEPDA